MQGTTQPIDRQTLLEKANKLIREHEDTLAGIEATDVVLATPPFWFATAMIAAFFARATVRPPVPLLDAAVILAPRRRRRGVGSAQDRCDVRGEGLDALEGLR